MIAHGEAVDETGTLRRHAGGFVLDGDGGVRLVLELHRVPVDAVEKRVRVRGTRLPGGTVEVEGEARV